MPYDWTKGERLGNEPKSPRDNLTIQLSRVQRYKYDLKVSCPPTEGIPARPIQPSPTTCHAINPRCTDVAPPFSAFRQKVPADYGLVSTNHHCRVDYSPNLCSANDVQGSARCYPEMPTSSLFSPCLYLYSSFRHLLLPLSAAHRKRRLRLL